MFEHPSLGSVRMPPMNSCSFITVLVVDDDDHLRKHCTNLLAASGFRVLEADNGMEALLIAAQHSGVIDLVITDLAMPRIGGAELGKAFKEIWPRINVLYISGSPVDGLPPDSPFLQKPFGPDALVDAVRNCVPSPEGFQDGQSSPRVRE